MPHSGHGLCSYTSLLTLAMGMALPIGGVAQATTPQLT